MNIIARALFVVGWVCIVSGVILAFANYQVVVGYEEYLVLDPEPIVEDSFTVFISYVIAGVVVGIMMFGFAEIVNLLDKMLRTLKNETDTNSGDEEGRKKNPSKATEFVNDIINK